MTIQSHRDLLVWQKSIDLVAACYKLTQLFPKDERFGLTSQMQRAAVSVAANIAEGRGRGTTNAFLNFCGLPRVLWQNWIRICRLQSDCGI